MLSEATLRNITKINLKKFLKSYEVKDIEKNTQTKNRNDYSPYVRIIQSEFNNPKSRLTPEIFDQYLFNELFYANNNYHQIYEYDSLFSKTKLSVLDAHEHLSKHPSFLYNGLLNKQLATTDYELCSTRLEHIDGVMNNLHLLIKVTTITSRRGNINFFVGITFDLVNKYLIVKFNLNTLEKSRIEKKVIITRIKALLDRLPFNHRFISLNETAAKKTIFQLFKELSLDAEGLLESKVPSGTDEKIVKFLTEMKVKKVAKDYVQQIKAVVYQDLSKTFKNSFFEKGWVFRFVFKEGDFTRASSRTDDFNPIYGSKVYWHLKELIFKEQEMQEAGFHWYTTNAKDSYVLVKLEAREDTMIIQYYYGMTRDGREKEAYVLRKIKQYLPKYRL
ncbi:hypothetical protein [Brevibacillus sp. FIR094]|uniref:hypothetical protein n=1 Tax=Brevibacillus sp. FIR094 TaxID=3134809 RepID=UPI003D229508